MPDKPDYKPGEPIWMDLNTPDGDASRKFYGAVFGWEAGPEDPTMGGYATFTLGGKNIAGVMPIQEAGQPPVWTLYICTSDATKTTELAQAAGAQVIAEPMDVMDFGRMAVFADPTGAVLGVWQPGTHTGSDIVDEPGARCWVELLTRDVAKAKEFYESLGWESETHAAGEMGGYTEFKVDGQSVAGLMQMPDMIPAQVPAHWVAYIQVADVDETAAKITAAGGTIQAPPMDIPPGRFAAAADPQGATFAIFKPAEHTH